MSFNNVQILRQLSRRLFIINDVNIHNKKLIDSWEPLSECICQTLAPKEYQLENECRRGLHQSLQHSQFHPGSKSSFIRTEQLPNMKVKNRLQSKEHGPNHSGKHPMLRAPTSSLSQNTLSIQPYIFFTEKKKKKPIPTFQMQTPRDSGPISFHRVHNPSREANAQVRGPSDHRQVSRQVL